MKSITFGPVTHEGKSYAYALGYGAYMMNSPNPNPYEHNSDNYHDFRLGWADARRDVSARLEEFTQEHKS